MKMVLIVMVLLVAAAISVEAAAEIVMEVPVSQDTTMSLSTGINSAGPRNLQFAVDGGTAAVKLIWLWREEGSGAGRDSLSHSRIYFLRSVFPPRSLDFATGPDSLVYDEVTAVETIVSISK